MIIPRRINREREHHTGGACAHDSGCGTQVRQFAPQLHALSFQHTHQHTHAALDDGAPCAMTLIIIGVSSAAAYHSLARTRSISAMRVYVYLCVDIPRHTCCAVGPCPNSWPPRDVCREREIRCLNRSAREAQREQRSVTRRRQHCTTVQMIFKLPLGDQICIDCNTNNLLEFV